MLDSGGAADPFMQRSDFEDEQRGSCHEPADPMENVSPLQHLQKKTRVPLSGLSYGPNSKKDPPALQIVLKKIGDKQERFGSVKFNLKRFQQKAG